MKIIIIGMYLFASFPSLGGIPGTAVEADCQPLGNEPIAMKLALERVKVYSSSHLSE
jgi:hypothetical protein